VNDVELFAGFDADLNQRMTIVYAKVLRFGQFVPHVLAQAIQIKWHAAVLATRVTRPVWRVRSHAPV
jgi:hypothetical protein